VERSGPSAAARGPISITIRLVAAQVAPAVATADPAPLSVDAFKLDDRIAYLVVRRAGTTISSGRTVSPNGHDLPARDRCRDWRTQ